MNKDRIEQKTQEILKTLGITKVPIDVYKISKHLGVAIVEEDLDDDISGLLFHKGKKSIIAVNRMHSGNRHRFTIAHELGHHELHKNKQDVFVDKSAVHYRNQLSATGKDLHEIEANNFAAALLMPKSILKTDIERIATPITDFHVERMALKYGVSELAMGFRLKNLGFID